jgi:tRNA pseudouridine38-40 synthase
MKLKLTLEYDGSLYTGWQEQPGQITVQLALEKSLSVYLCSQYKKLFGAQALAALEPRVAKSLSPHVTASGRTDSGVHALAQVGSFFWPADVPYDEHIFIRSLNGILPEGIAVLKCEIVVDSFDARYAPHCKQYTYTISTLGSNKGLTRASTWYVPGKLNLPLMCTSARSLVGTHDFNGFRASDCCAKTSVRTVLISELTRVSENRITYTIQGKGFLKQMVRIIVGSLVALGKGELEKESFLEIRDGLRVRNPHQRMAPAHGLTLDWVKYLEEDYYG